MGWTLTFVGLVKGETPPFDIYIKEKAILNQTHAKAYIAIGAEDALKGDDKKRKGNGETVDKARHWMCANFYDVRTFGAVMSTGVNCGQVRGPVQLTFARSVDPIIAQEHSITRMAVATEAEAEKQQGDNRTMGRKHTVPYGVYVAHGFISSFLAKQTGFDEDDLELLWQALENMFEHDRSAARGEMSTRGLYVFKHESELGNAHAHALFDRIGIARKTGAYVARSFNDYEITVDDSPLPSGVTLIKRV
ncbi:MAG: type I-C CRISPR-associated protein Cas7/Csd2 [Candidatus Accumulibacter sp. UW20]